MLDQAQSSAINPFLALLASLIATLSPPLLREASVGGGVTVALALALTVMLRWNQENAQDLRAWIGLGAGIAVVAAENAVIAPVLGLVLLVQGVLLHAKFSEKSLKYAVGGFVAVALLIAIPAVLRPLAPSSWISVGLAHGFGGLQSLDVRSLQGRGLGVWISQIGIFAFVLSCLGLIFGLRRASMRWLVAPFLVPLLLDSLAPPSSGLLGLDIFGPLRMFSLCAASVLAVLAVQEISLFFRSSKLPFARPSGILVVAFYATLTAVVAEDGVHQADRSRNIAAEVWTDLALEQLPPSALILTRSEALQWRLWAARLGSGMRPDVAVVPVPLLGQRKVAAALLREEPALATLLREISATGSPSEFGLSTVADVRPLFLELEPHEDRKLASHTTSESLWLRFAPQPYGLSDRRVGQTAATTAFYRVVAAARREEPHDEATLEVLAVHARSLAIASALVRDRESTQQALLQLAALRREPEPDDPLWNLISPQDKAKFPKKQAHR